MKTKKECLEQLKTQFTQMQTFVEPYTGKPKIDEIHEGIVDVITMLELSLLEITHFDETPITRVHKAIRKLIISSQLPQAEDLVMTAAAMVIEGENSQSNIARISAPLPPPPPEKVRVIQLHDSLVLSTDDYDVRDANLQDPGKASWLADYLLSLHLSSKNPLASLETILMSKEIQEKKTLVEKTGKDFLLTVQGDWNFGFEAKGDRDDFIKLLKKLNISLHEVWLPRTIIEKERGLLIDSAQFNKAKTRVKSAKDACIVLNMSKSADQELKQHASASAQMDTQLEALNKTENQEEFPGKEGKRPTDHNFVYTVKNGKMYGTVNLIPSEQPENELYAPKNKPALDKASNDLMNFEWRYYATTLLQNNLEDKEAGEAFSRLFGNLDFATIDFNETAQKYMVDGKLVTGLALRSQLEEALCAASKNQGWAYKGANGDDVTAQDKCRTFVTGYLDAFYKSKEFTVYNALLLPEAQYNGAKIRDVLNSNLHNIEAIKAYVIGSSPLKCATWANMGSIIDPKFDRSHADFRHPLCLQKNNGFSPLSFETQIAMNIAQALFAFKGFQNGMQEEGQAYPIGALEGQECAKGKHSPVLQALLKQFIELSLDNDLRKLDFEIHVLPPLKRFIQESLDKAKDLAETKSKAKMREKIRFDQKVEKILKNTRAAITKLAKDDHFGLSLQAAEKLMDAHEETVRKETKALLALVKGTPKDKKTQELKIERRRIRDSKNHVAIVSAHRRFQDADTDTKKVAEQQRVEFQTVAKALYLRHGYSLQETFTGCSAEKMDSIITSTYNSVRLERPSESFNREVWINDVEKRLVVKGAEELLHKTDDDPLETRFGLTNSEIEGSLAAYQADLEQSIVKMQEENLPFAKMAEQIALNMNSILVAASTDKKEKMAFAQKQKEALARAQQEFLARVIADEAARTQAAAVLAQQSLGYMPSKPLDISDPRAPILAPKGYAKLKNMIAQGLI